MTYVTLFTLSVRYFGRFIGIIALLSLVSAVGRAIQLGAFGDAPNFIDVLLEGFVEGARIAVVIALLGQGNIVRGVQRIMQLDFSVPYFMRPEFIRMKVLAKVGLSVVGGALYAIVVLVGNTLFRYIAEWLVPSQPEPTEFFLKNMVIIPFTFVFMLAVVNLWFYAVPTTPPKTRSR